jgi:hypothetical protein
MAHDYQTELTPGLEFEKFVHAHPLFINRLTPYEAMSRRADRFLDGVPCEIKLDRNWPNTHNLFIETSERSGFSGPMHPCGAAVGEPDDWYLIGNEQRVFLFTRAELRILYRTHVGIHNLDRSCGYLIRCSTATRVFDLIPKKPQFVSDDIGLW